MVLIQMVYSIHDAICANDYWDLSVLKRLADKQGIAILLIHHLRKEKAEDVFHRISGTTAISGAVDSSFTLVEEKRDSGRVRLTCVGRDIEYRELELRRSSGERVIELRRADYVDLERAEEIVPGIDILPLRWQGFLTMLRGSTSE